MSQLIAKHLAKSYNRRKVIHDVSLMINSGEVVGLLGPNGAGKTTCFYMIAGIVRADNGIIEINGTDITHKAIDSRAKLGLGYLPQEPSIFRTLSVADNIAAILETRKDIKRQQRLKISQLLARLWPKHGPLAPAVAKVPCAPCSGSDAGIRSGAP